MIIGPTNAHNSMMNREDMMMNVREEDTDKQSENGVCFFPKS